MNESKIIHTNQMPAKAVAAMSVQPLLANCKSFEITKITLDGNNHEVKKLESDCAYYVLQGTGTFVIANDTHTVQADDLIFIPKGTPYSNSGNMKLLVVDSPALDFDKVEIS